MNEIILNGYEITELQTYRIAERLIGQRCYDNAYCERYAFLNRRIKYNLGTEGNILGVLFYFILFFMSD